MKKFSLLLIPLAVVLAAFAYLILTGQHAAPENPAETAATREQADSSGRPDAEPSAVAEESGGDATLVADQNPLLEQKSETEGDLTRFTITQDEIGYVDVASIVQHLDPYSVGALLKNHQNLTGADESLEIIIDRANENEIWGYEIGFIQLIQGQPTDAGGGVFFSPSGKVSWMFGDILSDPAPGAGSVVIQQAEAEAIAREESARFIKPYLPRFNEQLRLAGFKGRVRAGPADMDVSPPELRYVLDSQKQLRAEWHVLVGAAFDSVLVRLAADTGKVVSVESLDADAESSDVKFRLCDGSDFSVASIKHRHKSVCMR